MTTKRYNLINVESDGAVILITYHVNALQRYGKVFNCKIYIYIFVLQIALPRRQRWDLSAFESRFHSPTTHGIGFTLLLKQRSCKLNKT